MKRLHLFVLFFASSILANSFFICYCHLCLCLSSGRDQSSITSDSWLFLHTFLAYLNLLILITASTNIGESVQCSHKWHLSNPQHNPLSYYGSNIFESFLVLNNIIVFSTSELREHYSVPNTILHY